MKKVRRIYSVYRERIKGMVLCTVCAQELSWSDPHITFPCGCTAHFLCLGENFSVPTCTLCSSSQPSNARAGQFNFDTGKDAALSLFLLGQSQQPMRTPCKDPVTRPILTINNPLWQTVNKLKQGATVDDAMQIIMSSRITFDTLMHEGVTCQTLVQNGFSETDAVALGYCINHVAVFPWPNGTLTSVQTTQASVSGLNRVKDLGAFTMLQNLHEMIQVQTFDAEGRSKRLKN